MPQVGEVGEVGGGGGASLTQGWGGKKRGKKRGKKIDR